MYAGGNVKPANKKTDRVDRRLAEEQTAPYPSDGMICRSVSARVGNVRDNDSSLIEPAAAA